MKSFSLLEFVTVLVRFLSILFLFSTNASIENYLISQTIYSLGYGLIGIYLATKYEKFDSTNFDKLSKYFNRIKKSYGKLRFDQILGLIPQHFDVILLGVVSDISSVGIYKFAKKLIEPINYLVVALNPWILNKLKMNILFSFKSLFNKILIPLSVCLVCLYYFFGKTVIVLLASREFLNSFFPMMILLIGFIFYLLTFWTRQYLLIKNSILSHTRARIINTVVFATSAAFLIDLYSYNGIAVSVTLGIISHKLYELKEYYKIKTIKA